MNDPVPRWRLEYLSSWEGTRCWGSPRKSTFMTLAEALRVAVFRARKPTLGMRRGIARVRHLTTGQFVLIDLHKINLQAEEARRNMR